MASQQELEQRIADARARQTALTPAAEIDTINRAVQKAETYRDEAGMAATTAVAAKDASLNAANLAADALTLTVSAESSAQGFAEEARDAKEAAQSFTNQALSAKNISLEAADKAADAYLGAAKAQAAAEGFAEDARQAADDLITADRLTAIENAVGGTLEDVTTISTPGSYATATITYPHWTLAGDNIPLFRIHDHVVYGAGPAPASDVAHYINQNSISLGVTAHVDTADANTIILQADIIGASANNTILVERIAAGLIINNDAELSSAYLDGGVDAQLDSSVLKVDHNGMSIKDASGTRLNLITTSDSATLEVDGERVLVDGESPTVEDLTPTTVLKHNRIYKITADGTTDLTGLDIAPYATAELLITFVSGTLALPEAWVWGNSEFDSTLDPPESGPTFEAGKDFCIVVRRSTRGVIANLAYTQK